MEKLEDLEKGNAMQGYSQVDLVNGVDAEVAKERSHFQALTPIYPDKNSIRN